MPSPGLIGRILPLSWMITAIVYGKGSIPRYSVYILSVFFVLSIFWTVNPAVAVLAQACALLAMFPGLLAVSSRRSGIILAVLPLIPLILLLVPFTGDEPHYSAITENLISPGSSSFSSFENQRGDPVGDFTHHQSFYPALLIPGYPLLVPGIRSMNIIFAVSALMMMLMLFRDSGIENWRKVTVLGFLLVPGSSVLGLVYPGWLALAVFLSAVYAAQRSRSTLWIIAAAIVLVLIKLRFVGISAGLLAALVIEYKGRRKMLLPILLCGLIAAGLIFDFLILNGRIFWVRYGNIAFINTILLGPLYRIPEVLIAAASALVDIESGLLWKAPWVLAAFAGLPVLRKRNSRLFLWLGLPALVYFLVLIFWTARDWSGVPTPCGRMLLPILPVLLASLGYMLKRRDVRILVWVSLGISAVLFTQPVLRFSYADGTDALISSIFGPLSNITEWVPSTVRLNAAVFTGWIITSVVIIVLMARRSRYSEYAIASVFLALCLFGGIKKRSWEAEDIPPEYRNFCTLYPDETDPESRKYWFFSRERMLELSSPLDEVILPHPGSGGDSLELTIFHRSLQSGPQIGIEVSCGEWRDSVYASSEVLAAPRWMVIIKDIQVPQKPENLCEIRSEFTVPVAEGSEPIRIAPLGVQDSSGRFHGVYLDRITFR